MHGSKLLRRLCAALLFTALAPLAQAGAPESAFEAGQQAAAESRYAQALEHYTQAAALGHRDAMRNAGLMLLYGEHLYGSHVHQDWIQAVHLLAAATLKGCKVSARVLQQIEGQAARG